MNDEPTINVTQSSMPELEAYIEEIKGLWDSKIITNMGTKHKALQLHLMDFFDGSLVRLFTNGHLALESIIEAMDLRGEVITTPFTFASTTHAIVRRGLKPVFCDINYENYTMDVDKIEGLITEHTSAIIPVHVYGHICNVAEIQRLAQKYSLKVIYDAAHAFGVKVDGKSISSYGDASMYSFHATKVFNTIEGGAVVTVDSDLCTKMDLIKNFGICDHEKVDYWGTNGKMNEFQAAMGLCNLRRIDTEIEKRGKVVKRYRDHLEKLKGIKMVKEADNVCSNHAYLPVLFEDYKYTRDEVYEKLKAHNIFARKYFYPLTSDFDCYKSRFDSQLTPVARHVANRILTLPLYPELELCNVDRICEIIMK